MRLDPIYEQRRKAYKFLLKTIPLAFIGFWFLLWLLMPLGYWIGEGNDALALDKAIRFWKASLLNPLLVFDSYFKWIPLFVTSEPVHTTWSSFIRWRLPLLPTLFLVMSVVYLIVNNPYDYAPQYFGYGREARPSDLKRMGVYPGKYLYLGDLKGYPMRLPDTRSAFCIGAPLSGKTVGVVVPNILKADNAWIYFHIDFVNEKGQFGFDAKDQFSYEHLDLRYDLRASKMQDVKNKVGIENMQEISQKIKEIKISQKVIPTDLYKEYLIKCKEESKILKKM